MRRAAKVDANHEAIVAALRAQGWKVCSLAALGGGVPDLLAHHEYRGWRLIEVKAGKGKLTALQENFWLKGWPVTIVRSVDDATSL